MSNWPVIGLVASLLRPRPPQTRPVPFGPAHRLLAPDRIVIESGPLSGTEFKLDVRSGRREADFALLEPGATSSLEPVAHCHFDRDPGSGLETLYSIVIRPDQRRKGLAALLVRLSLRELFGRGRRHYPRLRKLMVIEPGDRHRPESRSADLYWGARPEPSLHNIGIGVIALELGFVPAPETDLLLNPARVKSVQLAPATSDTPPGLLVRLGSQPGTVLAALVDQTTHRPVADVARYQRFFSPRALYQQACAGQALLGNVDYVLPPGNISRIAARLADNPRQLDRYAAVLRRARVR